MFHFVHNEHVILHQHPEKNRLSHLVRQRLSDQLDAWLERATPCGLRAFQSFANGLREDYQAVKAGLTFPWSTGPVEGNINRLQMLKRQRYGRATLALLRQRVLYAA